MKNYTKLSLYMAMVSIMTFTFLFSNAETNRRIIAHAEQNEKNTTVELSENIITNTLINNIIGEEKTVAPSIPTEELLFHIQEQLEKHEEEKRKKLEAEHKAQRQVSSTVYAVITEYLNIRDSHGTFGDVVRVVNKDDVLNVKERTLNGWLILNDGTYVNEKYTKPITEDDAIKLISQKREREAEQKRLEELAKQEARDVANVSSARSYNTGSLQVGITTKSNATAEQFEVILSGTQLSGIGQSLITVEDKFGINAFFTLAVAQLESGHGKSKLSRNKNNLFGMNAVDSSPYTSAFTYGSKGESIIDFGQRVKAYYIDQGLTTLVSINNKYSSSSSWAGKVESLMYSNYNKMKN